MKLEIVGAKKWYGKHATDKVVLLSGTPVFHGDSGDARLFYKETILKHPQLKPERND